MLRGAVSSPLYLSRLDGVRALAALSVLAMHVVMLWAPNGSWPTWSLDGLAIGLMSYGWTGVIVFFVLSGWLISLPFWRAAVGGEAENEAEPAAGYGWRRLGRVLPLFWAQCLLIWLPLLIVTALPGIEPNARAEQVVWQILLLFQSVPGAPGPWLSVWWTLPVELAFYLLLPLLFRLPPRWRWPTILLLALTGPLLRMAMAGGLLPWAWSRVLIHQLPGRIDLFLLGVAAAGLWVQFAPQWARLSAALWRWLGVLGLWGLLLLSLALGVVSPAAIPRSLPLAAWQTAFALLVVVWIIGCAQASRSESAGLTGAPALRWIGRISYSVYLWHLPLLAAMSPWFKPWIDAPWKLLPAAVLAPVPVLAVSAVSFYSIERPARQWCKRRARRQTFG